MINLIFFTTIPTPIASQFQTTSIFSFIYRYLKIIYFWQYSQDHAIVIFYHLSAVEDPCINDAAREFHSQILNLKI